MNRRSILSTFALATLLSIGIMTLLLVAVACTIKPSAITAIPHTPVMSMDETGTITGVTTGEAATSQPASSTTQRVQTSQQGIVNTSSNTQSYLPWTLVAGATAAFAFMLRRGTQQNALIHDLVTVTKQDDTIQKHLDAQDQERQRLTRMVNEMRASAQKDSDVREQPPGNQ